MRIREGAGDSQLEGALPVGVRIALPQPGSCQVVPQFLDLGTGLTTRELYLELPTIFPRQGSGIDERHAISSLKVRVTALLDDVEQSEHCTPGIPDDRQRIEPEFAYDQSQIFDVRPPGDWDPRVRL